MYCMSLQEAAETSVWVPRPLPVDIPWTSPGCYHESEDCAGADATEVSLEQARRYGFTACGRCAA